MSNRLSSTDSSSSESSSSSDSDDFDELGELMLMNMLVEYEGKFLGKNPMRTSQLTGREYMVELLNGHPRVCYDMFRMDKDIFLEFCHILRVRNFLERTDEISIEESVAMFLFIIGHNVGQRVVGDRFQHSIETVSRHFKNVLRAVCRYGKELIAPSTNNDVPLQIRHNSKYYPWFKDCIGAIDGTHVSAWVPEYKQIPYRGRKVLVTQNVMCTCSFDMMFTYAYSGWEGTANDSRVFLDAITRPEAGFPLPPTGKYYVVDSGYPCTMGFLPPYRGERYHLQEYRGGRSRQPRTPKELFNYRHSSLRNVIERCFGVLKARFPILKLMPKYPLVRQRLIVIACCAIHNFIRQRTRTDHMFIEYEREDVEIENSNDATSGQPVDRVDFSDARASQMATMRDEISNSMWASYTANG